MELALPTALAALAVVIVFGLHRRRRIRAGAGQTPTITAGPVTVVLDLADNDPSDARVQRLVHEAARRATAQSRDAGETVVVSRTGRLLGRLNARRPVPPPARTQPAELVRPPASRRSAEAAAGIRPEPKATPRFDAHERPDPVDVVCAIVEAGGRAAHRDGDVIRAGDETMVIVPERADVLVHDAMNQAYLAFRETGAAHGVVIVMGAWNPIEVRRRELLDPSLRYVDGAPLLTSPIGDAPRVRRTG